MDLVPTSISTETVVNLVDLRDFIVVVEGVCTSTLCADLVNEYVSTDEWQSARIGHDAEINQNKRNVASIQLSLSETISRNEKRRRRLDGDVYAASTRALRSYQRVFPHCVITEGTGFELLRYSTGSFYRTHTDSFARAPRSLSCSIALNDDFEGGCWSFFDGQVVLRPPKGSALLFPSNFMFPHEITEVTDGTRYSIVTWMI
jgi:predicted 2-oxoglutarate/Fe(II)-dependent dioxygenase YbiX